MTTATTTLIQYKGKTIHGVTGVAEDSDPQDGSLHGFYTFCGRQIDGDDANWLEVPDATGATCGICVKRMPAASVPAPEPSFAVTAPDQLFPGTILETTFTKLVSGTLTRSPRYVSVQNTDHQISDRFEVLHREGVYEVWRTIPYGHQARNYLLVQITTKIVRRKPVEVLGRVVSWGEPHNRWSKYRRALIRQSRKLIAEQPVIL